MIVCGALSKVLCVAQKAGGDKVNQFSIVTYLYSKEWYRIRTLCRRLLHHLCRRQQYCWRHIATPLMSSHLLNDSCSNLILTRLPYPTSIVLTWWNQLWDSSDYAQPLAGRTEVERGYVNVLVWSVDVGNGMFACLLHYSDNGCWMRIQDIHVLYAHTDCPYLSSFWRRS